jgi:cellulose synthase/poly-beta-1,6-N-acetylglucosamine synthase-like glycosyltransferase
MTVALILWLAGQAVAVLLVWHFAWRVGKPVETTETPPIAIVVAIKGYDRELDGFLDCLFTQDYPVVRFIFAVEAATDAALPVLEARRAMAPDRVTLVIASLTDNESQKITNLRAALPELRPEDEILVFPDADIWPEPDWLRRVVEPIMGGETDAVTAYPWLVLKDHRFTTLLIATISAGVATVPRAPMWDAAWGGMMAIKHTRFDEFKIAEAWRGAMCEDLQLTKAVRQAGGSVYAPRELLLRTHVGTTGFAGIARQARRWYMLIRLHMPVTYALATAVPTLNAAGWLLVVFAALTGATGGAAMFAAAMGFAVLRTSAWAAIVAKLWGKPGLAENLGFLLFDPFLTPLAAITSAGFAWSTLFMRRTTWSGVTYEIQGPHDVKVLARRPV